MRLLDCSLRHHGERSNANLSAVALTIADIQEYLIRLTHLKSYGRYELTRPGGDLAVNDTALDVIGRGEIGARITVDLPRRASFLPNNVKCPDAAGRLPGELRHDCGAY